MWGLSCACALYVPVHIWRQSVAVTFRRERNSSCSSADPATWCSSPATGRTPTSRAEKKKASELWAVFALIFWQADKKEGVFKQRKIIRRKKKREIYETVWSPRPVFDWSPFGQSLLIQFQDKCQTSWDHYKLGLKRGPQSIFMDWNSRTATFKDQPASGTLRSNCLRWSLQFVNHRGPAPGPENRNLYSIERRTFEK